MTVEGEPTCSNCGAGADALDKRTSVHGQYIGSLCLECGVLNLPNGAYTSETEEYL